MGRHFSANRFLTGAHYAVAELHAILGAAIGKKKYEDLNEVEKLRWDFWNVLRQHLLETQSFLRPGDSKYGYWLLFKLGVTDQSEATGQHVRIQWVKGNSKNGIEDCSWYHVETVYYGQPRPPAKSGSYDPEMSLLWFKFMCEQRQQIHNRLGFKLEWDDHAPKEVYLKAKPVIANIRDRESWPGYINDMRIQAERLHAVFQPHARAFSEAYGRG